MNTNLSLPKNKVSFTHCEKILVIKSFITDYKSGGQHLFYEKLLTAQDIFLNERKNQKSGMKVDPSRVTMVRVNICLFCRKHKCVCF